MQFENLLGSRGGHAATMSSGLNAWIGSKGAVKGVGRSSPVYPS